ncbi:PREDICTED: OTU domain-containing protein 5-A isoform X7 [Dinoponera quadriceps]|uniref:ubiquitinyl hydrolase 1 n=1 Tax=Dinoponera quadriceps TaxID=609295 RepID=A0A6P3XTH6_DINQU|nr:PREDICTED: OTU domain-containing protein 5-A isoform X7 [Dinoponera quadriceps]
MTILSKKKTNASKDRTREPGAGTEVDVHHSVVQNEHNSGNIALPNSPYQASVDRREEKHFEESGPSHGKRHRQRVSPHSSYIGRSSRAKRERERDRGRERERERERERQATPPAASCSGIQGTDTSVNGRVSIVGNASNLEHELANGYNSGDEYTGRTGNNLTLAEWQERDRWFEKHMRKKGFIVKKMDEDGACLFRAVADQVYGDQEMHGVVRKHCMDYIASNKEFFRNFVAAEDFSNYVNRKRLEYVHGNHIEMHAMSEMYNRSIQLYCYSTEPIDIFHTTVKSDNEPIRLSYQRDSHYNSIVDPYKATIGVGLGLPAYNPGAADRALISDAVRQNSGRVDFRRVLTSRFQRQTMLEDKIKATDWEATNEAIEEQVARESYLQWLRDNEMRKAVSDAVRYSKRSPQHQSATQGSHLPPDFEVKATPQEPVPGSSKEAHASPDIPLFNRLPPEVFGLTDWEDSDILSQVLATSQQEYLDSLKQSRVSASAGSDSPNTIESNNSSSNNS